MREATRNELEAVNGGFNLAGTGASSMVTLPGVVGGAALGGLVVVQPGWAWVEEESWGCLYLPAHACYNACKYLVRPAPTGFYSLS